jgi:hypothetical protein
MKSATLVLAAFAFTLALLAAGGLWAEEAVSLFDGKTLEGWDGNPKFWSVKDGAITGTTTADNPTSGNTFLIWKKGELKDFELSLKFRIEGGNSGIQSVSTRKGAAASSPNAGRRSTSLKAARRKKPALRRLKRRSSIR